MKKRNRVKAKLRLSPDPILKVVCEPVGDDEDVSGTIRDMMHILTNSKTGVGLAAPQAGHTKRVIVVKTGGGYLQMRYLVMTNPIIIAESGDTNIRQEGCLSYPGIYKDVERHVWISIKYFRVQCRMFFDFDARIIQHEIEHLNGRCKVGE